MGMHFRKSKIQVEVELIRLSVAVLPGIELPPSPRDIPPPLDTIGAHSPHGVVEVDGYADVIRHDADDVTDARTPVGAGQVEQAVLLGHSLDDDFGSVEQGAEAVGRTAAQLFAEQ